MFDSPNKRLIIETVFDDPDRVFHLRELAEEINLSPSTVSRLVKELQKHDILTVNKSSIKMEIKASKKPAFTQIKRSYNLMKLEKSGFLKELENKAFADAIILFGSYSRGEDKKDSDIDIAVVNGRETDIKTAGFEKKLGRKLNIHNINLNDVETNFVETLANGIVLRGYLEI